MGRHTAERITTTRIRSMWLHFQMKAVAIVIMADMASSKNLDSGTLAKSLFDIAKQGMTTLLENPDSAPTFSGTALLGAFEKNTGKMLKKCYRHAIPTAQCAIKNVDEKNIKKLHGELADTYKELSNAEALIDTSKKPVMQKITSMCTKNIKKTERLIKKEVNMYVKKTLNSWIGIFKNSANADTDYDSDDSEDDYDSDDYDSDTYDD